MYSEHVVIALQDGSTMLIEAAKGGHTTVVNLLLDWPSNILSPSSANLAQLSPPPSMVDVSEVSHHVTLDGPLCRRRLDHLLLSKPLVKCHLLGYL